MSVRKIRQNDALMVDSARIPCCPTEGAASSRDHGTPPLACPSHNSLLVRYTSTEAAEYERPEALTKDVVEVYEPPDDQSMIRVTKTRMAFPGQSAKTSLEMMALHSASGGTHGEISRTCAGLAAPRAGDLKGVLGWLGALPGTTIALKADVKNSSLSAVRLCDWGKLGCKSGMGNHTFGFIVLECLAEMGMVLG
eukprot:80514-Amphidinium_carterae.3